MTRLAMAVLTVVSALWMASAMLVAPAAAGFVNDGELGAYCERDAQCLSNHCADGQRCAPVDGTGRAGDYCHHNNHCQSRFCGCNKGGFGFCKDWEDWPQGVFDARWAGWPHAVIGFCQ